MKRFGIFLLTVSLIAAMVGCVDGNLHYSLSISSTPGGSVTAPGEGISFYEQGMVVSLVASPDSGYQFVNWIGDVGTIDSVSSASTTITMNEDCSIIASFELPEYYLTISSTAGGSVISPGQGTFGYGKEQVIDLVAQPKDGYCFVEWTGDVNTIADVTAATTIIAMNGDYSIAASFMVEVDPMVAAGAAHTVGLQSDGRVVAVGRNDYGQCDVSAWTGIVQVAGGGLHTVGLKSNGTVVAVGKSNEGQCNVGGWTDIVQVAAGWSHTLGLKADGRVVAVGRNAEGQCGVSSWTGIIQVAAGAYHTVGLKSYGTAVAVGWNPSGALQIGDIVGWIIVQVDAGLEHSVGLSSDGLVTCAGWGSPGQCDFYDWTDIVQVAAGSLHTAGLKSDGTVVAVGENDEAQCEVGGWTLK